MGPSAGLPDKLKERLEKLQDKLAEIARGHDAVSYSITVGVPVGVSVTVTFGPAASVRTRRHI